MIQKAYGLAPVRAQSMVPGPGLGYTSPKGRISATPERKRLPSQAFKSQERQRKRAEELRAKRRKREEEGIEPEDMGPTLEVEHMIRRGDLVVLENIEDAPYLNGLRGHVRRVFGKSRAAVVDLFDNDRVSDQSVLINIGEARYYLRG